MTDLDLRREKRYDIVAPVDYWWPTLSGTVRNCHGRTRDISNSGVMVAAEQCPPPGTHIQLKILVPRHSDAVHPLELHGEGTVVRVENPDPARQEQRIGFAATVQFHPELPNGTDELVHTPSAL